MIFCELTKLGARPEGICLPDCGWGRKKWETAGLKWADTRRTFFGVRDAQAIHEICTSHEDPLKHQDVIALNLDV